MAAARNCPALIGPDKTYKHEKSVQNMHTFAAKQYCVMLLLNCRC